MRSIPVCALALFLATPALAQQVEASTPSVAEPLRPVAEIVAETLAAAPEGTRYGLVVQKKDGSEILAIAPDERFIPASNTKIYTTLAAYRQLAALEEAAEGTGVRIEPAPDGMVDVVLEGRGEATVSSARDCRSQCLATLADAVAARTHRVRNVVGDASWYPDERWSAGMSWNNIPFRYGTAIGALRRMEQLIQEAVVTVPRALIAETIDLVAVLSGRGASRRLAELARIEGLGPNGDYRVTPASQPLTGDPS